MKWELTDGTVVHLGGKVDGDSSLAATLRATSARAASGAPDLISVGPQPGSWERLDLGNPQLVNIWVRTAADKARVSVVRAPELDPLPDDDRDYGEPDDSDDGLPPVY